MQGLINFTQRMIPDILIITIPKQEVNEEAVADYIFVYKLQEKQDVSFKLTEG